MKNQVVVVNFRVMAYTGILYIVLVFSVWLLIRLTIACFRLPSALSATQETLKENEKVINNYQKNVTSNELIEKSNSNDDILCSQDYHEKIS
ncbi:uncharacterized protein LOC126901068 isoform X2 [Daktulosphaira vitifoliae]|uniref:uncharacterized protein LOC126901068 isoform X2 n=1 Tax=Daktulosphaira vitifoliae TaxID=58002 RepID=UPI0021A9A1C9|nr:uncharacterized protein LOC126901068 isoform X2 [Daktulosphaira vitifoliae]